jgi:hypothetical protein
MLAASVFFSIASAGAGEQEKLFSAAGFSPERAEMPVPEPFQAAPYGYGKSAPASRFAEAQRHARLLSGTLDGTAVAQNVRWALLPGGTTHFWDTAAVTPALIRNVYWGNHTNGVGHAFLVLEFAPGGFVSARKDAENGDFLVVSVEARMGDGQTYSALLGEVGGFRIVWNLVAFENYIRDSVSGEKEDPFSIYRIKLTGEQKLAMAKKALKGAFSDHEREYYNTTENSCVTNALDTLNSVLPWDDRIQPLVAIPGRVTARLDDAGLLDRGPGARFTFTAKDPSAGGYFTAR